jgi:DNA-binding GntR family transcriptional regulator
LGICVVGEMDKVANYSYTRTDRPADPRAVRSHTLAERVYRTLHDEITSGVLRPGERLVRRELSGRLGVSPMLAAEALLRLELDGLVESRPLHGARVRPLTVEDYRGEELLREALECLAARLCAENASDAELATLMSTAHTVDRVSAQSNQQSKPGMEMHRQIHVDIARCGRAARLAEELDRVWTRRHARLTWLDPAGVMPDNWHERLIKAIASRDPDRAEAKMREHVRYHLEDDLRKIENIDASCGLSDDSAATN